MHARRPALLVLAIFGLAIGAAAAAQETKKALPPNAVGAGTNWNQTVSKEPAGAEELDRKQVELVQKVNAYFNQITSLTGGFVQTSADNKRLRGKFYVKQPGRFRFDYNLPSKLIILSDGQQMAIQDTDINTDDRIPLENTPFRVLLRKDVDLLRDARILEVREVDDVIVLALQDKSPDAPGRIKLFLAKKPKLELKEWITTDSQGLETKVELSNLVKADDLDPELFNPAPVALQKLR